MATLDSSAAWQSARRVVSANRDVLVAIAGVFYLLPGLIGTLALPKPDMASGMTEQQMAQAFTKFYASAAPVLLLISLPMLIGYLTMLVVMLDRDRPTVGAAIGRSFRLLPGYLASQILTSLALSGLWVVVVGALSLAMPPVAAGFVGLLAMIYPLVRIMLIGPEMVVARHSNPIRAIMGSLAATRREVSGILLYFGPAMTLFMVIYGMVTILVTVILANAGNGDAPQLIGEAVVGVLFAVGYTYFTAMIASTYQQLGMSTRSDASLFE
ncbi:hypothetical protein [Novosphingobium nitrogenifigens]|uniref:hypothetical protein n=1 Tax=Novosphingobium nitrogenifigens TaxID=378548 RepID=UPI000A8641AF|nr:hypothetical protein [Novosphingobium nitrogenifigens]